MAALPNSIANSLHGFGGFLRCETCGYRAGVDLTDEDTTRYLANGWPRHCGYTMRWWTQRQIDANEVPEFPVMFECIPDPQRKDATRMGTPEWTLTQDLNTSLLVNNIRQSEVGKALDALREAGFIVEVNVQLEPNEVLRDLGNRA